MTILLSSGMLLLAFSGAAEATFFKKSTSSSSSANPYSSPSFWRNGLSYPQSPVRGRPPWLQQQSQFASAVPRAKCDTVSYGYNPGKRPGRQCDRETSCEQGRKEFSSGLGFMAVVDFATSDFETCPNYQNWANFINKSTTESYILRS